MPGYQLTPSEILAAATLATPRTGRILAVMRQGGRLLALRALVRCIAVLRRAARGSAGVRRLGHRLLIRVIEPSGAPSNTRQPTCRGDGPDPARRRILRC